MPERLGQQVELRGGTGLERAEREVGEDPEQLVAEIVLGRRDVPTPVPRRHLDDGARHVGGDVGGGEDAPGGGHRTLDARRPLRVGEGRLTLVRDRSKSAGERARVEARPTPPVVMAGGRITVLQEHGGGARLESDVVQSLQDRQPEMPVDRDAGVGGGDRRLEDDGQRKPAPTTMCRTQPGDRARHGGCETTELALSALDVRPRVPRTKHPSRHREHVLASSRRRAWAVVDREALALLGKPRREVAVSREPGIVRLDDACAERSGDHRVDRVSPQLESGESCFHLCGVPRGDRSTMAARDLLSHASPLPG